MSDGRQRLKPRPVTFTGVALAFGGAVGQAVGLVMGKHGMGSLDAFAATQIRVIAGMVGFAVLLTALGWWPHVRRSVGNRSATMFTAGGALAGPFLGVALLMVAVQCTSTGVASTIVALVPLVLIPAAIVIDKERVTLRAVCGTAVAVLGVILLVWNR
jgi:drug/metabolite transporter (DMT)-like permease